ncbi:PREDICTED: F-box protein At3g07870-like [Erythranthe guttata]|nr:PREDICTED: F-box protein At3g07870-like [Erythranthe guttata]|eukprot:XP_012851489.1 PREDICTED: F-box protein At3g07870-like [Erythranthe guttata]
MVLECYNWLLHLFNQIIIGDNFDDKKKWRLSLTLPSWSMHQIEDRPRILRYFCYGNSLRISIIDGKSEKECKMMGLESIWTAYFAGCCNGLALFELPGFSCIVVNPLSKKSIETISDTFLGGRTCGFFFHPVAKEYRILNVRKVETDEYEYQIYLFGAKKWRKIANPYFSRRPTHYRNKPNKEIVDGNPAIVNDALHWCMNEIIMVFDIIKEEFSVRPAPERSYYWMRNLYVKDDQLCFCRVIHGEPLMDIWILEDYENWSWVRKYVVNLDWDMNKYPVEKNYFPLVWIMGNIRVISIRNKELVLFWKRRGIFSYHLEFNTVEKLHLRKSKMDDIIDTYYDWTCGFEAYNEITSG